MLMAIGINRHNKGDLFMRKHFQSSHYTPMSSNRRDYVLQSFVFHRYNSICLPGVGYFSLTSILQLRLRSIWFSILNIKQEVTLAEFKWMQRPSQWVWWTTLWCWDAIEPYNQQYSESSWSFWQSKLFSRFSNRRWSKENSKLATKRYHDSHWRKSNIIRHFTEGPESSITSY